MQNCKELKVWSKAHKCTLDVYKASKVFPKEETYSLTNQLRRATSSVPANIAEGCGKRSPAEFAHYLNIAPGSSNESEYFLLLSKDLAYLPQTEIEHLNKKINEVKAMLIALIGKVRQKGA